MRKLNKNKKAISQVVFILGTLMIVLILAFLLIRFNTDKFKEAGTVIDTKLRESAHQACELSGKTKEPGTFLDTDEDGFPDPCDNCVGPKRKGFDSRFAIAGGDDTNMDFIAKACQPDGGDEINSPNTGQFSKKCKEVMTDDGRCILSLSDVSGMKPRDKDNRPSTGTVAGIIKTDTEEDEEIVKAEEKILEEEKNKCDTINKCEDYTNEQLCTENLCEKECVPKYSRGIYEKCIACPSGITYLESCRDYSKEKTCLEDSCGYGPCKWNPVWWSPLKCEPA
tara:strand:- start:8769 stop:9611 length:843 start_codon:yes stop_codon:yes gene_type:complete